MSSPVRVQLSRRHKMPPNTVSVARPTRWGNPFKVGRDGTAAECVRKYRDQLFPYSHNGNSTLDAFYQSEANIYDIVTSLSGKNLACWCKPGDPCHADVLLEVARLIV